MSKIEVEKRKNICISYLVILRSEVKLFAEMGILGC